MQTQGLWRHPPQFEVCPDSKCSLRDCALRLCSLAKSGTGNLRKQNLRVGRHLNKHIAWHTLSPPSLMSSAGAQPLPQLTERQDTHYPASPQTLQLMSWTPEAPPSTPTSQESPAYFTPSWYPKAMCNFPTSLKDARDFGNLLYESLSRKCPAFRQASGASGDL